MDLFCSCKAQQRDDTPACGPPHDGIVYQNNFPAFYDLFHGGQFDVDLIRPVFRRDKSPADVLVLDKADAVGYSRLLAVTEGRVKAGVWL